MSYIKIKKRIGVLTGGGDAPGINPALKALVYKAETENIQVIGIYDGWKGLLDGYCADTILLTPDMVRRWDRDGGTNLGSSRTNPFNCKRGDEMVDRSQEIIQNIEGLGLDYLIVIGGEDTLGVANKLSEKGVPVVGIPKTIDKDLYGTDYTLGFATAVNTITEIIERSRTPAGSHHWVQVIEVMGRYAGHIALWSGTAGGAYMILIPECPFKYERIFELLSQRLRYGMIDRRHPRYAVVVVAEGAKPEEGEPIFLDEKEDEFGHKRLGGIGNLLEKVIKENSPFESRAVVLGHPQRGGSPCPTDRIMGLMFGTAAIEAIVKGETGKMVSAKGIAPACTIELVPLSEVTKSPVLVDIDRYYNKEVYNIKREILST
jgi:6-phosphofructokinase 1